MLFHVPIIEAERCPCRSPPRWPPTVIGAIRGAQVAPHGKAPVSRRGSVPPRAEGRHASRRPSGEVPRGSGTAFAFLEFREKPDPHGLFDFGRGGNCRRIDPSPVAYGDAGVAGGAEHP